MMIHNEIGVTQPIAEIGKLCRSKGVFFHVRLFVLFRTFMLYQLTHSLTHVQKQTDAAQAVGKVPVDVNAMNIDLMSISGHKLYGPKGIGCLYVRRKPRVRLEPLISGGGQERGLRSGTVATPLVVGLGEACRIAQEEMVVCSRVLYQHSINTKLTHHKKKADAKHITALSQRLVNGIMARTPSVTQNGDPSAVYPGCVNLSFAYVEGESLLMALKDIALSSGSACTSASLEPSYVLRALGADDEMAHSSIRFGIGRFTTEKEIDFLIDKVATQVARLREMSPLWEMVILFPFFESLKL